MGLTEEQVQRRRRGLGGTDAAAVLGISPWKTALDVYFDKMDVEQEPFKTTEWMDWGNRLEDIVARTAAEQLGHKIKRKNKVSVHREYPWMIGYIDRRVVGQRAIYEVKTAGWRDDEWGDEMTDQIPEYYIAQTSHYLAVENCDIAYVPVLFMSDRKLRVYRVLRDDGLVDAIVGAEERFWNEHIMRAVPPKPQNLADIRKLWPKGTGEVEATKSVKEAAERLVRLKESQKELSEERTELETLIQNHMGEAAFLKDEEDNTLATFKHSTAKRVDVGALRERYPRIAEKVTKVSNSRSFLLKLKLPEEG